VADSASADVRAMYGALKQPTPVGFAVGTSTLDATVAALAKQGVTAGPVAPGARDTPAGQRLSWRSAGLPALGFVWEPFLIEWGAGTAHPATTSPAGCTLISLTMRTPNPTPAHTIALLLDAPFNVERAQRGTLQLALQCPTGRVVF
jgi:hypothetical protein